MNPIQNNHNNDPEVTFTPDGRALRKPTPEELEELDQSFAITLSQLKELSELNRKIKDLKLIALQEQLAKSNARVAEVEKQLAKSEKKRHH